MGGGYGGLESYLRWSHETKGLEEMQKLSIEESIEKQSQMLEQSGNMSRGGDTASAIVQREEEQSTLIVQVLRKKLIEALCQYTGKDESSYTTKDIKELKDEWHKVRYHRLIEFYLMK
ncbi:MAG: hypothetical protein UX62_C0020G0004 [Microgenomates group bacterium GW2011_GWA2_46_7]|nr:MAG: hypothetical protein UX62_C0020G0004 [Microgenomates group bacterium GW2011_GWA2_46_7]